VRTALVAAETHFTAVELIVVDDGSHDATATRVRTMMAADPRIRLIAHERSRGFGASFDSGRREARLEWTVMIQGDGPFSEATLRNVFARVGEADVICGYWNNPQERSWLRRLLSRAWTTTLNLGLGYRLRYYNGLQVHRTSWLRQLALQSSGFGFQAELLIAALRDGKRYIEVATDYIERPEGGATKIFRLRNLLSVAATLLQLLRLGWSNTHSTARVTS
jgi:glycosyltransferase involved in cell wall biosynthesis